MTEQIKALFESGKGPAEIGRILGLSRFAVRNICAKNGWKLTTEQVRAIRKRSAKVQRGLRSDRLDQAVKMKAGGKSYREIARELGFASASAVRNGILRREARV